MRITAIKDIPKTIDKIVADTLLEYAQKIYSEAMAGLGGAERIRASFSLTVSESGHRVSISTSNDLAAYIEFGTGNFASTYLAGKPQEMVDEALKFFVSGAGTMPARPYLFPAYNKYREDIPKVIDQRIQKFFDSIK